MKEATFNPGKSEEKVSSTCLGLKQKKCKFLYGIIINNVWTTKNTIIRQRNS